MRPIRTIAPLALGLVALAVAGCQSQPDQPTAPVPTQAERAAPASTPAASTASHPAGPFEDSGTVLTPDDQFTIDAHPFRDDDGRWYLYYCRDFLEPDGEGRVGTGIVVDRLVGMTRLAGERRTVLRPHADWQLYERQREWYGRVWDWYTVEGAFVRKHDGRYYCLYSGGAWREPNYGVSCVLADHPMGPFELLDVVGNDVSLAIQRELYLEFHRGTYTSQARTKRGNRRSGRDAARQPGRLSRDRADESLCPDFRGRDRTRDFRDSQNSKQ